MTISRRGLLKSILGATAVAGLTTSSLESFEGKPEPSNELLVTEEVIDTEVCKTVERHSMFLSNDIQRIPLKHSITNADMLFIYINGALLKAGADFDYVLEKNEIRFVYNIPRLNSITIVIHKG